MIRNINDFYSRLTMVSKAWSSLHPHKKFSDMTHEEFVAAIEPSRTIREEIAELDTQLAAAIARRTEADAAALKVLQRVVHCVRGDKDVGEDSELYKAMGYVPRTVRNSLRGIRRSMNAERATEGTT